MEALPLFAAFPLALFASFHALSFVFFVCPFFALTGNIVLFLGLIFALSLRILFSCFVCSSLRTDSCLCLLLSCVVVCSLLVI